MEIHRQTLEHAGNLFKEKKKKSKSILQPEETEFCNNLLSLEEDSKPQTLAHTLTTVLWDPVQRAQVGCANS